MDSLRYTWLLKGLRSHNASHSSTDKTNLFICSLSKGEFPLSCNHEFDGNKLTIDNIVIDKTMNSDEIYDLVFKIFNQTLG